MTITLLRGPPDAGLIDRLTAFEQQFRYPLGDDRRFSIEHGGDGWRFFAAMGEAAYVVAEDDGQVTGVIGSALRHLWRPDGSNMLVLYVGDLKIASGWRNGMVLIRMFRALVAWTGPRVRDAFAVVMDGTAITPNAYTGRAGIPAFRPLDAVTILWLRTATAPRECGLVGSDDCPMVFAALASGRYRLGGGDPSIRSRLAPRWLVAGDGRACGRLEDTMGAKRLRGDDGREMVSAHLSYFVYSTQADGSALLSQALGLAAEAGYPMLFTAVPAEEIHTWRHRFSDRLVTMAPATVYGTGLEQPGRWLINTADI